MIFHSLFVPDSEGVGWGKTTFKETLISVCITVKLRIRNRPQKENCFVICPSKNRKLTVIKFPLYQLESILHNEFFIKA